MPYKDPEQRRAYHISYRATHCEKIRVYLAAYYAAHKEEFIAYTLAHREEKAAYYVAHRVERVAAARTYAQAHPLENAEKRRRRRALQRSVTIGPINLEAIKVRDQMRCAICGKRVGVKDLSFDHSWPLSLGGPHSQENQRVAHLHCNKRRGAGKLPVQMVLC